MTTLPPPGPRTAPRVSYPLLAVLALALPWPSPARPPAGPAPVALEDVVLVSRTQPGARAGEEGQCLGGYIVTGTVLGGDFLSNVLGDSILGRVSEPLDEAVAFR